MNKPIVLRLVTHQYQSHDYISNSILCSNLMKICRTRILIKCVQSSFKKTSPNIVKRLGFY